MKKLERQRYNYEPYFLFNPSFKPDLSLKEEEKTNFFKLSYLEFLQSKKGKISFLLVNSYDYYKTFKKIRNNYDCSPTPLYYLLPLTDLYLKEYGFATVYQKDLKEISKLIVSFSSKLGEVEVATRIFVLLYANLHGAFKKGIKKAQKQKEILKVIEITFGLLKREYHVYNDFSLLAYFYGLDPSLNKNNPSIYSPLRYKRLIPSPESNNIISLLYNLFYFLFLSKDKQISFLNNRKKDEHDTYFIYKKFFDIIF